jgi:hypothetical protein
MAEDVFRLVIPINSLALSGVEWDEKWSSPGSCDIEGKAESRVSGSERVNLSLLE